MDSIGSLIVRYYEELWNQWQYDLIPKLLSQQIQLHGSLGHEIVGRESFLDYMKLVRDAFPDFHNSVEELIIEANQAAARLTFSGTHRGTLFGCPPTGRYLTYEGAAFFAIDEGRITRGYVIADRLNLVTQLRSPTLG